MSDSSLSREARSTGVPAASAAASRPGGERVHVAHQQRGLQPQGAGTGEAPVRGQDIRQARVPAGPRGIQRGALGNVAVGDDDGMAVDTLERHPEIAHRPDRTRPRRRGVGGRSCTLRIVPETPLPTPTQRVIDAASRKGVTLDVHAFTESTHTAEDAAAAVGAELGQIVKSLVFVAPRGRRRPRAHPVPGLGAQPRGPRPARGGHG